MENLKQKMIQLKGIPASPGVAVGKAYLLDTEDAIIPTRKISDDEIIIEIERFKKALNDTKRELLDIKKKISKQIGLREAEIFSAHLLVLEDVMLIDQVIERVRKEKINVEYVFKQVLAKYVKTFAQIDDEYLKERLSDINDVGKRILQNLIGKKVFSFSDFKEPVVLVAYDLSPSDTATLKKGTILGFATDIGGKTSHTAIMAKSLEIPAVVGLEQVTEKIANGDTIIIDGIKGLIIINPTKGVLAEYKKAQEKFETFEINLSKLRDLDCVTLDGRKIELVANIELPEEIPSVLQHGAKGIGLYRTEYFYMNRKDLPSEEEQFEAYKSVAQHMNPYPVIIRTLDLGGDKFLSQLEIPYEMNPYLGWRAIRFCLARPEIFLVQLRAILRASVYGNLKIMYPMISSVEEVTATYEILAEAKEQLRKEKIKFDENLESGIMIEVPSAAINSDTLAKKVKFFSIGTNDLIQYTLAVDRVNEKISYLYDPAHPAVVKLVKMIIDNAHKNNIWVGMCGEMAGEIYLTILLVGLGLDEISVSPIMLPEIKQIVRAIKQKDAEEITKHILTLTTTDSIKAFLRKEIKRLMPNVDLEISF